MSENNGKAKLWVYAVVLFTSAFIVLLITAYSQIRINRNITDYQNQIFAKENEKNQFMINYKTASEEIARLEQEVDSLNKTVTGNKDEIDKLKEEQTSLNARMEEITGAYELLAAAEEELDKGNIVNSAEILLDKLDATLLSANGNIRYEKLKEATYKKASSLLYRQGYERYTKKLYSQAAESLIKSIRLSNIEYFTDDCYYFLAYCEYRTGNNEKAKEYLNTLLNGFPKSSYNADASRLLKSLE